MLFRILKGMFMQKPIITLLCAAGMIISTQAVAQSLRVKPTAPARYTVKPGDTLWGISGKYLYRPWQWPALWQVNRNQVRNPHLIYPGQVLVLRYINGRPVLGIEGGNEGIPTIKLSPRVRDMGSGYGINTINVNFYSMFMKHAQFVTNKELREAARLVGGPDNAMLYSIGNRVYADGITEPGDYLIFRLRHTLKDPNTKAKIGTLVEFVGEASTLATNNSALSYRSEEAAAKLNSDEYYAKTHNKQVVVRTAQPMMITESVSEISKGDYLIRKPEGLNSFQMMPHAPEGRFDANIVEIVDGVSESGQMQTIILNKGAADGLDKGTVLSIYKRGKVIKSDWRASSNPKATQYVNTPTEEIALAMVYRVGEHVSSAIILESIKNVNVDDLVSEPGRDMDTFGNSEMENVLSKK